MFAVVQDAWPLFKYTRLRVSRRAEETMLNLMTRFHGLVRNDEGQDLIEYALLAGLIALVAVVAIGEAGVEVNAIWGQIVLALRTA